MKDPTGSVNSETPAELDPPVDPWTLPAQVGIADEIPPAGAVEVGGAGTGIWVWVSTLAAGNPIGALVLLVLCVAAIAGAVWWGVSTPKNTPFTQTDSQGHIAPNPRLDIVNNPLPDDLRPYQDATQGDSQRNSGNAQHPTPAAPPVTETSQGGNHRRGISGERDGCGAGYRVNPGWIIAAKAPYDPREVVPPWRNPKYGPLDSHGYVVRCVPDKK